MRCWCESCTEFILTDGAVVLTTDFTVDYKTDLSILLPRLISGRASSRVSKQIPLSSYLLRFGADGFDVRVGFWIDDPENGKNNIILM